MASAQGANRRVPLGAARIQPEREFRESKGKEMKAKESKLAFFYFLLFFRIGTFQRVTSEKNKKLRVRRNSRPRLWAKRPKHPFRLLLSVARRQPRFNPVIEKIIAIASDFVNHFYHGTIVSGGIGPLCGESSGKAGRIRGKT
jgi:hypothetical protein